MTRQLLFILTISSILSCANTNRGDCRQFKNGKFILRLRGQQGDMVFHINRQDSIQMETDEQTEYYTKLRVRWTDKCKYEVIVLESTFPFPDSIQNSRKTIPLKVEIIAWAKDYYVYSAHRGNFPTITDTTWVEKIELH